MKSNQSAIFVEGLQKGSQMVHKGLDLPAPPVDVGVEHLGERRDE
jgi:hypothetical protein